MPSGRLAARVAGPSWRGTTFSRLPEKTGIARGAGMQIVASSQDWVAAPEAAICVVGTWPCSGILHSCWAARSDRPKQATVPRTGWSWKSSRIAASAAFMVEKLSSVRIRNKCLWCQQGRRLTAELAGAAGR